MELKLKIKNKRISLSEESEVFGLFVADNSCYYVGFDFDNEWDGIAKTVRFINGSAYVDTVLESGATGCLIPRQILTPGTLKIGVFGGNIHTSEPFCIICRCSILSDSGTPAEPSEDVYSQIIELFSDAEAEMHDIYTSEGSRCDNEIARTTAEVARNAAEGIRISTEAERVSSESERISAEALRIAAEAEREQDYEQLSVNIEEANEAVSGIITQASSFSNAATTTKQGSSISIYDALCPGKTASLSIFAGVREIGAEKTPSSPHEFIKYKLSFTLCKNNMLDPQTLISHGWIPLEDGSLHALPMSVYGASKVFFRNYGSNDKVFVSLKLKYASASRGVIFKVTYMDGTSELFSPPAAYTEFSEMSFTTNAQKSLDTIYFWCVTNTETYIKDFIISKSNQVYEPFSGTTHSVSGIDLYAVSDSIFDSYNAKTGVLESKCTYHAFDGTEAISYYSQYSDSQTSLFSCVMNTKKAGLHNLRCTHFPTSEQSTSDNHLTGEVAVIGSEDSNIIFFRVNNSILSDITNPCAAFSAWLTAKYLSLAPVEIIYETSTAVTANIDALDVTISNGNKLINGFAKIDICYRQDINFVINSLIERITALEG